MKKLIILFLFSLFTFSAMMGQSVTASKTIIYRVGSNNELISNQPVKVMDIQTQFYIVIKDEIYPVWLNDNGKYYIIKTSKKTLKSYKSYINVQL